jgi:hypothetical protein
MNKKFSFLLILLVCISGFSCSKEAGEGGNSTIYGKIIAHNYNAEFTNLKGIYPAADEDVFIIYGGDRSYSERVRTSYDGVYEFKYLRPGDYTVFAYSKDSTLTMASEMYAVIRKVTITENKQSVEAEEMKIFK